MSLKPKFEILRAISEGKINTALAQYEKDLIAQALSHIDALEMLVEALKDQNARDYKTIQNLRSYRVTNNLDLP